MSKALRLAVAAFCVCVASRAGIARANLLINGDFEMGPGSTGATPVSPGHGWFMTPETNGCKYDGTTHTPSPATKEGLHRGSTDVMDASARQAHIYQTVTVQPGLPVRLTGWLCGGTTGPVYTHFIRVHEGAGVTGTVLATFDKTSPMSGWQYCDITGTPTTNQITVEWGYSGPFLNWNIIATHVDGLDLTQVQPVCTGEPTIEAISPAFGSNNATLTGVQLTGTGFDNTCQVILRANGVPDIQASGETGFST